MQASTTTTATSTANTETVGAAKTNETKQGYQAILLEEGCNTTTDGGLSQEALCALLHDPQAAEETTRAGNEKDEEQQLPNGRREPGRQRKQAVRLDPLQRDGDVPDAPVEAGSRGHRGAAEQPVLVGADRPAVALESGKDPLRRKQREDRCPRPRWTLARRAPRRIPLAAFGGGGVLPADSSPPPPPPQDHERREPLSDHDCHHPGPGLDDRQRVSPSRLYRAVPGAGVAPGGPVVRRKERFSELKRD